jgi:hypothetical protein
VPPRLSGPIGASIDGDPLVGIVSLRLDGTIPGYWTIRKASVDGTLSQYDGVFGGYFARFVSIGRYLSIVPRPSNQKRPRASDRGGITKRLILTGLPDSTEYTRYLFVFSGLSRRKRISMHIFRYFIPYLFGAEGLRRHARVVLVTHHSALLSVRSK